MQLKGKIIYFLGDSITEGQGVADLNNRYDNVIKRNYELKEVYNYGIGGTRIAHQRVPSEKPRHDLCFCGRAYNLNPNADIIVVYGGVNDYIHGDAPIGKWGDSTPATFYGGVRFLMNFLKTNYTAKIVFVTPARLDYNLAPGDIPSKRPSKQKDALPLIEYVKIIIETAKDFDIPVLDMYHNLGINPKNPDEKEKYTVDGLHFNDLGHSIIAKKIGDFLLSI